MEALTVFFKKSMLLNGVESSKMVRTTRNHYYITSGSHLIRF